MGFQKKYTFIPLPFNFAQRNLPHALAEEGSTLVSSTDSPAFTSQCDQKPASLKSRKTLILSFFAICFHIFKSLRCIVK